MKKKTNENLKNMEKTKKQCQKSLEKIESVVKARKEEYLKCKDVMECSICMERKVDCVFGPCGHLYCSQCITGFEVCPHCRNYPERIQKLFFT